MAWWYCSRSSLAAGEARGPRDDARVRRAAVELVALPHLERGVERHRPAVGVVVVGLDAAEVVEHREVLVDVVGDPVEDLVLVDRSVGPALAAGAVVGDHDDHRVLALAGVLEVVEQAPDLLVGVAHEPCVHLGHPAEQPLLLGRQGVPRAREVERREGLAVGPGPLARHADRVQRRQLGVGRDDAQLLLTGERLLAHRLVAHVELALEALDPFLRGVVRGMARAGRVIEEERLLGGDRLGVTDEFQRLVGEVLGEVVALVRRARRVDGVAVVDEVGIPLVRLGAEEAVEALEAAARRPVAPRGREVHLGVRAQVPFADHVGVPALGAEDLLDLAVLGRDHAAGVREADRRLGDAGHAVARVVAPGQQARARRRAERRRVELRVAQPVGHDAVDVRRGDRAAVAAQRGEPDVVEHDVDDARGPLGCARRLERRPVGHRVPDVDVDRALERLGHAEPLIGWLRARS